MTRTATLLLLLGLVPAPGCGILTIRTAEDPVGWPLLEGAADRPTALVRRGLGDAQLNGARHQVDDSGLFSRVTHQEGQGGFSAETDYVLDISLDDDSDAGWYTVLGVVTLGALPVVWHEELILTCTVRDAEHRELGSLRERIGRHRVAWIPFLPLTVLASALPGEPGAATFDVTDSGSGAIERELLRQALRRLLARAHERFQLMPGEPGSGK